MIQSVLFQLPHLILHGPCGTGKTSTILAFAREVFGPELVGRRVLELNASDERGIATVRDKIKKWSRMAISGNRTLSESMDQSVAATQPRSVPWKLIILDEADMMTVDAQSALRRIIEDTAQHTRFVLICNYLSK